MGDVLTAMNDYKSALQLDNTHVLAHFNIGNILFHQRLFDQAVTRYSKAISHCSTDDDSILVNRAIAYFMLRNMDAALEDFARAIEANPYSAHGYFNRGNLYKSLGEYEKAEEDYKKGSFVEKLLMMKEKSSSPFCNIIFSDLQKEDKLFIITNSGILS